MAVDTWGQHQRVKDETHCTIIKGWSKAIKYMKQQQKLHKKKWSLSGKPQCVSNSRLLNSSVSILCEY